MKGKRITVKELCHAVGMKYKVLGSADKCVTMPSPIDEANEESVSFYSRKAEDALETIRNSTAKVIICSEELEPVIEGYRDKTFILVSNPRLAFIRMMQEYFQEKTQFGIHPTAVIDDAAEIHPNVYVGPHCNIGRCQIGEGTIIDGNVHIYSNVKIGGNVIIQAGTVIGARGFGFERNERGELENFPHIGDVVI